MPACACLCLHSCLAKPRAKGHHIALKGSYVAAKRSYIALKESYIAAKGCYMASKRSYIAPEGCYVAPKGSCIAPRGSYIAAKGHYIAPKGSYIAAKRSYIAHAGSYIAAKGFYIAPEGHDIAPKGSYLCLTMQCLRSQNHKPPNHKTTKPHNHRSNLAGVESIWFKQGRKLVGQLLKTHQALGPEVAWPLMDVAAAGRDAARADSTGSGTFRFPAMASGCALAAPVHDGSQPSPRTQDQGSVSDSDTDWDAGSDFDTAPVRDCDADEVQKLSHMVVAMAEALED